VRQVNLGRLRRAISAGRLHRGMLAALVMAVSCSIGVASSQADAGPSNTVPPTISVSGTPTQGQTLTETPGVWTNTLTITYQWEDCSITGTDCAPIPLATNPSYVLTNADVGDTIVVQEIANATTTPVIAASAPTAVVIPLPPVNTTPPTISVSGTPTQGQTLTETPGVWTNNPTIT